MSNAINRIITLMMFFITRLVKQTTSQIFSHALIVDKILCAR
ncbi:MAG TPA: hypothetical protein VGQ52_13195 [Gemmatimonadaceae bacterium]|nr:hypothetical protein [Gemmatimonadaceae bacterium]